MRVEDKFVSAQKLEQAEPELIGSAAEELRVAAEADHKSGVPRGKAYVRRIQELAIRRPELGIAVSRVLGLEHIVEELLSGISVEGVPGIGPDGSALPPTHRHRTRRRGAFILGISAIVLLVEAITADGLASIVLYAWTAVGLGLFFVGGYLVMLRE
jgi:hypothetical protein